jgi:hypothetical protein
MLMEEKKDNGFFGDFTTYLLKLAGGLLPIVTFVPLFINRTHKILNITYDTSFWIFAIIYFLLPILVFFSWIYYCISRRAAFNATNADDRNQVVKELALKPTTLQYCYIAGLFFITILLFILHFVFSDVSFWAFNLFMAALFIVVFLLARRAIIDYVRISRLVGERFGFNRIAKVRMDCLGKLHTGLLQFCVLFGGILVLLVIFLGNQNHGNKPAKEIWRQDIAAEGKLDSLFPDVHKYLDALKIEQDFVDIYPRMIKQMKDSVDLLNFQIGLQSDSAAVASRSDSQTINYRFRQYAGMEVAVIDSLLKILAHVYYLAPDSLFRDALNKGKAPDIDSLFAKIRKSFEMGERQLIDTLLGLYKQAVNRKPNAFYYEHVRNLGTTTSIHAGALNNFVDNFHLRLEDQTKKEWSVFLGRLKFYALAVFGIFSLWLIVVWFYFYTHYLYQENFLHALEYPKHPEAETPAAGSIAAILGPVKTSATVIFLLAIPFFRSVDPDKIDLKNPFLHLSLANIIHAGAPETPPPPIPSSNITINIDSLVQHKTWITPYDSSSSNNIDTSARGLLRQILRKVKSVADTAHFIKLRSEEIKREMDKLKRKVNHIEPDYPSKK